MKKILISEELATSLHEQIGHERFNATLYLYIASFLKNKGLNNIAKHFDGQHDEEIGHSRKIIDLLTDLGADVKIPQVDGCEISIGTILDIATVYLNREILTTESLDEIKKLSIEVGNPVVEEKIRYMISLQQKEYEEATDFSDKADILGSDWKAVLLWDASLED